MDRLPSRLLPLVTEEFPHSLTVVPLVCSGRRQRVPRQSSTHACWSFSCIREEEDEEEGCSSLEEHQAQRSFLLTLELLRRRTGGLLLSHSN